MVCVYWYDVCVLTTFFVGNSSLSFGLWSGSGVCMGSTAVVYAQGHNVECDIEHAFIAPYDMWHLRP